MDERDREKVLLFLLRDLERMNLLMERLRKVGVISEKDHVLAQLEADLRHEERRARAGEPVDQRQLHDLRERIDRLEKSAP